MQTQNPFLDEMAKLSTAAMGLAQAAGDEAKAAFRAQADRMVAELDLIRRDDFDALKAEVAALRAEVEALRAAAPAATKVSKTAKPATKGPKTGGDA
jgi:BMFP domain-containing protein YqiC